MVQKGAPMGFFWDTMADAYVLLISWQRLRFRFLFVAAPWRYKNSIQSFGCGRVVFLLPLFLSDSTSSKNNNYAAGANYPIYRTDARFETNRAFEYTSTCTTIWRRWTVILLPPQYCQY